MSTTCHHALFSIVDVFTEYYECLAPILLFDILKRMLWCVQQGSEQLARAAINTLENLIISNGEKFTSEMWDEAIRVILEVCLWEFLKMYFEIF